MGKSDRQCDDFRSKQHSVSFSGHLQQPRHGKHSGAKQAVQTRRLAHEPNRAEDANDAKERVGKLRVRITGETPIKRGG